MCVNFFNVNSLAH